MKVKERGKRERERERERGIGREVVFLSTSVCSSSPFLPIDLILREKEERKEEGRWSDKLSWSLFLPYHLRTLLL